MSLSGLESDILSLVQKNLTDRSLGRLMTTCKKLNTTLSSTSESFTNRVERIPGGGFRIYTRTGQSVEMDLPYGEPPSLSMLTRHDGAYLYCIQDSEYKRPILVLRDPEIMATATRLWIRHLRVFEDERDDLQLTGDLVIDERVVPVYFENKLLG